MTWQHIAQHSHRVINRYSILFTVYCYQIDKVLINVEKNPSCKILKLQTHILSYFESAIKICVFWYFGNTYRNVSRLRKNNNTILVQYIDMKTNLHFNLIQRKRRQNQIVSVSLTAYCQYLHWNDFGLVTKLQLYTKYWNLTVTVPSNIGYAVSLMKEHLEILVMK